MTLDEAIARLKDPNVHEMIFEPGQLVGWLSDLKQAKLLLLWAWILRSRTKLLRLSTKRPSKSTFNI